MICFSFFDFNQYLCLRLGHSDSAASTRRMHSYHVQCIFRLSFPFPQTIYLCLHNLCGITFRYFQRNTPNKLISPTATRGVYLIQPFTAHYQAFPGVVRTCVKWPAMKHGKRFTLQLRQGRISLEH